MYFIASIHSRGGDSFFFGGGHWITMVPVMAPPIRTYQEHLALS